MLIFLKNIVTFPIKCFRALYDWTIHWAKTKHASYTLFGIAFIESSFFPIPPDVLLIAMTISEKKKWAFYAFICTLGSVLGACFGYFIGWSLYETIGKLIVETYHLGPMMNLVGQKYVENAFLTVFTAAFTPIPYKVITIAAGLFKISIVTLIVASIIGRAGRFFLVAGLLRVFGKKISDSIEKYFDIFSILFVVLLFGGFILLKHFAK
ncbi:DedA family protein [Candidatus Omnitrophus magneticus]|uniref:DedA family protein n=1 Tax=Candidatus Omnitrophus magneticus TaxID=1609969 RepID=A0A0F0CQL4_9BACT|nr:DedA family protein [Candidatus Omnitrophus magneticus]